MTRVHHEDDVIYEVAFESNVLVAGEDDDRTDEELVAAVEERTTVAEDMTFPDWTVFVSDPPDAETLRYVDTATRINVFAPYGTDVFPEIRNRVEIDGEDEHFWRSMVHSSPTHPDDFDREIHLDLTE
jgi:hypothetical protein